MSSSSADTWIPYLPFHDDDAVIIGEIPDGSGIYYATPLRTAFGGWHWEIRKACPESGSSQVLARVAGPHPVRDHAGDAHHPRA